MGSIILGLEHHSEEIPYGTEHTALLDILFQIHIALGIFHKILIGFLKINSVSWVWFRFRSRSRIHTAYEQ